MSFEMLLKLNLTPPALRYSQLMPDQDYFTNRPFNEKHMEGNQETFAINLKLKNTLSELHAKTDPLNSKYLTNFLRILSDLNCYDEISWVLLSLVFDILPTKATSVSIDIKKIIADCLDLIGNHLSKTENVEHYSLFLISQSWIEFTPEALQKIASIEKLTPFIFKELLKQSAEPEALTERTLNIMAAHFLEPQQHRFLFDQWIKPTLLENPTCFITATNIILLDHPKFLFSLVSAAISIANKTDISREILNGLSHIIAHFRTSPAHKNPRHAIKISLLSESINASGFKSIMQLRTFFYPEEFYIKIESDIQIIHENELFFSFLKNHLMDNIKTMAMRALNIASLNEDEITELQNTIYTLDARLNRLPKNKLEELENDYRFSMLLIAKQLLDNEDELQSNSISRTTKNNVASALDMATPKTEKTLFLDYLLAFLAKNGEHLSANYQNLSHTQPFFLKRAIIKVTHVNSKKHSASAENSWIWAAYCYRCNALPDSKESAVIFSEENGKKAQQWLKNIIFLEGKTPDLLKRLPSPLFNFLFEGSKFQSVGDRLDPIKNNFDTFHNLFKPSNITKYESTQTPIQGKPC